MDEHKNGFVGPHELSSQNHLGLSSCGNIFLTFSVLRMMLISILGCADSIKVTDVSDTLASYNFSVKEVHNGCHKRQDSTIFQLPHPEDGGSTVPRTVADHTLTSSSTRIFESSSIFS